MKNPARFQSWNRKIVWFSVSFCAALLALGGCSREDLFEAAQEGKTKKIEHLLNGNPGLLFSRDSVGRTVLHRAALGGAVETVKVLLDRGMRPGTLDRSGFTALDYAYLSGSREAVELLKQRLTLSDAVMTGDLDLVREVIERDPSSVNRSGPDGTFPLHLALENGDEDIVQLLLESGASPNDPFPGGESPLQFAIRESRSRSVNLLLAGGADPNFLGPRGRPPLYLAIRNGDLGMVVSLLENGADPNLAMTEGLTPIQLAAQKGSLPIFNELLKQGAVLDSTNKDGRDALYWARKHHYFELAHHIEEMIKIDDD